MKLSRDDAMSRTIYDLRPIFFDVICSFHHKRTPIDDVVVLNARVEIKSCATAALHPLLPIHIDLPTSSPGQSPHLVHTAG